MILYNNTEPHFTCRYNKINNIFIKCYVGEQSLLLWLYWFDDYFQTVVHQHGTYTNEPYTKVQVCVCRKIIIAIIVNTDDLWN